MEEYEEIMDSEMYDDANASVQKTDFTKLPQHPIPSCFGNWCHRFRRCSCSDAAQ